MSLLKHRHIVPAIPDCCRQVGRVRIFQEQNDDGHDGNDGDNVAVRWVYYDLDDHDDGGENEQY